MTSRHEQIVRSDYTSKNIYSEKHPDALSTGDKRGKGTGWGGHSHYLPNCNGTIGVFGNQNFDTSPESHAGNNIDNETRETAMARSMYNASIPYSAKLVDTSANLSEGQYRVP